MSKTHIPKLRHHKASGQGFVELNGWRHYLGRFERPETRQRYHDLLQTWEARGRQPLNVGPDEITVVELLSRFMKHAASYYRGPDGKVSRVVSSLRAALRPLTKFYETTPVKDFGPLKLKAVREHMITTGWSRSYVNRCVSKVRQLFRWGVENELVDAPVSQALEAVSGLKRGRCEARESKPVRPVPETDIVAVRPFLARVVAAIVDVQLYTAARPGEVCRLRPVDFIDTAGKVWTARLEMHKTAHHGRERLIYFGPQAQAVVAPFLADRPLDAFLFSPAESEIERRAELHEKRTTPLSCGNRPGSNRKQKPCRQPGECYTTNTYAQAIRRACVEAGVPIWSPGRLRHNAATEIRRQFGIEAAQLLLGHAKADVTQVYAETNHLKALEVAGKVG